MQKVIYLLFCVVALLVNIPSTSAAILADSIHIQPDVDSIYVCPGGDVTLSVDTGTGFDWSPAEDFDDPSAQTVVLTPSASQWYYVTATVNDSICTDSIYVTIPSTQPTFAVQVSTQDTICPLDIVSVAFEANYPITGVTWNTTAGVIDSGSFAGTDIAPLETTEYIVTVVAGGCTLSDTFTIDVIPFRFRLLSSDTIYLCLGDSGTIRHDLFPLGAPITWSLLDSTINILSPVVATVKPTVSTSYTATATFGECVLSTTTFVRVDSLPDSALVVIPLMDPYCAGEMITIFAERADTMKYPDIMFQWFPMDGQIQDSTNTGNVFVTLQDTTEFFRIMTNNACVDTSSVKVNVIPPDVPLSVMDTTLCPGDMFMVEILDLDVMDIEWTPEQGLSCTDCLDPTVTVQANPITYMVQAKKDRCTVSGMLNVNINPPLPIIITPNLTQACPGDQISFSFDGSLLTEIEVSVSGGASVSCNDCTNPVVTYNGGTVTLSVAAAESSGVFCGVAGGSAIITQKPNGQNTIPAIDVCANTSTTIPLAQFGFINPEISIINGDVSCTDCLNPIVDIEENSSLIVQSESEDTNFCQLTTIIPLSVIADTALIELTYDPTDIGQGESVTLTLVTFPSDPAGTDYNWTVNGMQAAENTSTLTAVMPLESNIVIVEWTNSFGCLQSAQIIIAARAPEIRKIPNAFTPDRELNTHFKPDIVGNIEIEEMLVFNRWGQVVYEGTSQDGWDGRRDGEPAPPEVYVYLIKFRYPDGRVEQRKGDVTLIR